MYYAGRVKTGVSLEGGILKTVKHKHGLKILYAERSDEFFFDKAVCCVADIVGNANVKSSSPMNGSIVIFVSCEEAVNAVHGIVISNVMHIVETLVTPFLKVSILVNKKMWFLLYLMRYHPSKTTRSLVQLPLVQQTLLEAWRSQPHQEQGRVSKTGRI